MRETPTEKTTGSESLPHKIWRWFIAPSPQIQKPDERRQAAMLSAILLGFMIVGGVMESITVAVINVPNYTGYRETIGAISVIAIIYGISRTRYIRLASVLTIIATVLAIYITGWAQPYGVLGGLFDYLFLPLWLGSIYLSFNGLAYLAIIELIGLLVFPMFVPQVTLNDILVGPFSFNLVLFSLLIVLTRHRNLLEEDRRSELAEKEQRSRREAARAGVLLRVAERLNAQLDLDALLKTISEEIVRAFGTPVSQVMLYDKRENALLTVAGHGLSPELLHSIPPFPKAAYDSTVNELGTVFTFADLLSMKNNRYLNEFKALNFRSIAFATMHYEHELVGSLNAVTLGGIRNFTEDELLLLHGIADQAALAIINTRLYKDASRRLNNLQALRTIDIAIATNHDLRQTLEVLLDQITGQLAVDATNILLLNEPKQQLEYGASRGFHSPTLRYTRLHIGEGMAGRAAQQRKIINIRDLRTDPQTLAYSPSLAKEGFASYYAAPLIAGGQIKGVLEVFHRSILEPDEEWLNFLQALAGQAAIAIETTTLFEDLRRSNEELSKAYDSTIEGWSHALDLRDKETEGHTLRVTELTIELARIFGFSDAELIHIRRGALLHDIGKMGVPDKILLKEGPLTPEEWDVMRQHPVFAHEMLQPIDYLRAALDIPYCHHEKWDGTGYPRGLKGEEIPLIARIFAAIDVWDALTSDRPYRAAWLPEKVLAHVQKGAGQHFDPQVVDLFIKFMREKYSSKLQSAGDL
jgi:putative nucleotidyltransferase with HDIG domain